MTDTQTEDLTYNLTRRQINAWSKKVGVDLNRSERQTLSLLIRLSSKGKVGDDTHWFCEPRLASMAKNLELTSRTIFKHMAFLRENKIAIRFPVEGRRRTIARSQYRYYLTPLGEEFTRKIAAQHGFTKTEWEELA